MEEFLAERAPDVAFYSEDRGLVDPARRAEWVLVVDPIDGTRPAMAGLESACVSVAAAPLGRRAGDGRRRRRLRRRDQVRDRPSSPSGAAGSSPAPRLSANTRPRADVLDLRLPRPPGAADREVLGELIDGSSVGGGTFDLGSATFDMTRIVTGQLDAYVEPGPRMVDEVPGMREEFERVGGGAVLNNSPYDLAAAALCLEEAGAVVTDAARRLARRPPAARLRPRVPDVVRGRGQPGAPRPDPRAARRRDRAARSRGQQRSGAARGAVCLRAVLQEVALGQPLPRRLHAHRRPRPGRRDPRAGGAARGQAGPARERDRVRRRRLGDPLHARAADARRRPRRALAGDPRPRGVLQRHQADAQLAPGRRAVDLRRAVGDLRRLQPDERAGASTAAGT